MDLYINVLIAVAVIVGLAYVYLTRNYGHWSKRGIPTVPNALPGLGHTWPMYAMTQNTNILFHNFYEKGKGLSMIGFYDMTTPGILIRDPELVKSVLATNFNKFGKNVWSINPDKDPIISKNPFFADGDKWKTQRAQLSGMLSFAKLKMILGQIADACDKLEEYVDDRVKVSGTAEFEMKRLFSRYTSEIVANSVFGVEGYSFDDNHKGRSFLEIGETIFVPAISTGLKNVLTLFFPFLSGLCDVSFLPKDIDAEFRRMIDTVVDVRLEHKIVKNDILQNILESEKTDKIDKDYVLAHAGSFFVDMYETTSITMNYVSFQLAMHVDVQEKARNEVRSVMNRHNGQLTYDALKDLTYMDRVINESTRLNTAFGTISKVCTEKFKLVGSDGLSLIAEPGNIVSISIQGLHHDPEHWPDPKKFDPDRFTEDNKNERNKFVHLPFGEGPRMCPGRVLGTMMLKLAFARLLDKYSFSLSSRTKMPLKLDPRHFVAYPLGGLWINVRKIV